MRDLDKQMLLAKFNLLNEFLDARDGKIDPELEWSRKTFLSSVVDGSKADLRNLSKELDSWYRETLSRSEAKEIYKKLRHRFPNLEEPEWLSVKPKPRKTKHQVREGDVFQVPLGEKSHAMGRVLRGPVKAFYDPAISNEGNFRDVIHLSQPLFIISAHDSSIQSGQWKVIGNVPLDEVQVDEVTFCRLGPFGDVYRHLETGHELPGEKDDLKRLELAAVWAREHVEHRLHEHLAGRVEATDIEYWNKRISGPLWPSDAD